MQRLEVWFTSGLFRAFPHVTKFDVHENTISVTFGNNHKAFISKDKIDFFELMEEESEE